MPLYKRQNQRLEGKIGAIIRKVIAPRFEEMGGRDMGRRGGARFIHVQPEPDDLLDLRELIAEAKLGGSVESRISAENKKRFDRALADRLGEIVQGWRTREGSQLRLGANRHVDIAQDLVDLRDDAYDV